MKKDKQPQLPEIRDYYNTIFEVDARKKIEGEYVDLIESPLKMLHMLDVHSGRSYREKFFRYLEICPGKKILDIGCGFGDLLKMAEKKGLVAYGVDISEKAVEVARWNTQLARIVCGNAEDLPFKSKYFDYVTFIGGLEHLLNPISGLKEMMRVCVKNSKMLIVVPNYPVVEYLKNKFKKKKVRLQATEQIYENVLTLREWKRLLKGNGLKILKVYKDNHTWIKKDYSLKDWLRILRRAIRKMLPLRFSYQFIFLCTKNDDLPR